MQAKPMDKLVSFDSDEISFAGLNTLDATIVGELCTALEANKTITSLNFSGNTIGDSAGEHIGMLLFTNPNIVALNVSACGMSDPGVCCICRCARRHRSLKSLDVSRNRIGDSSLLEIDKLVQVSNHLAELLLMDTDITFEGSVSLVSTMIKNRSLLYVSLPYSLGFPVLDEVNRILRRNWRTAEQFDQKAKMAQALKDRLEAQRLTLSTQWKPKQEDYRCTNPRLATVAANASEWNDPKVNTNLLYLHVLDQKTRRRVSDSKKEESESSVRSERGAPASPRSMSSTRERTAGGAAAGTARRSLLFTNRLY